MKSKGFRVDYLHERILELASECEQKILVAWALDCAERVLILFEKDYPNDMRPRNAIEAGRAWIRGEMSMWNARKIALTTHAAARDVVENIPACAAARSAGQALSAVHVSKHATHESV